MTKTQFRFEAHLPTVIIIEAVRGWRRARDNGDAAMPNLAAALQRHACEILSPCFASLIALNEAMLGRGMEAGEGAHVTSDETDLVALLIGAGRSIPSRRHNELTASLFDTAVRSTRVMMAMTMKQNARLESQYGRCQPYRARRVSASCATSPNTVT